jgi:hypothetical protein
MDFKICKKCGKNKPILDYIYSKRDKIYSGSCRECKKEYSREYVKTHIEQNRKRSRTWAINNRERSRLKTREWALLNPDKKKENDHKYGQTLKAKTKNKERKKRERAEDPIRQKGYSIKYYKTHKNKILNRKYIYNKKRRKIDLAFRLKDNLRRRINQALHKNKKTDHTMDLVGCSIDFLKGWIESKFQDGMTWSDYGKWHIDHIRPCASFNLIDPEQQKECFHYTNLQPLWAIDNKIKSSKIA